MQAQNRQARTDQADTGLNCAITRAPMIDKDIHLARALLVESNPMLRSIAAAQLRDLGIAHIIQATRVKDARMLLEDNRYEIVLCNREFEGSDYSGQDLLDELRRERLLPHGTVFVMITGAATYHQVVEAAEAALDGFLVRPYTAANLAERLTESRKRKRELDDVFKALDAGHNELALARAAKRFQDKAAYWVYCGRLVAELLMTMQRHEDARRIFERLLKEKPEATWAKLGLARARIALGESTEARRLIAEVLSAEPASADAHDLLGRILIDQCSFDEALAEYRIAADLTPGCLLRAQHAGALAFYQGQNEAAAVWLERALAMGVQSKLFDALSLLLLAMLRFDRADAKGVATMQAQLKLYSARFPASQRLVRMEAAAAALLTMMSREPAPALEAIRALAAEADGDAFDLEAANLTLALWARMPALLRPEDDYIALVERIAMRFCVSKAIGEVLAASAGRSEPALGVVRRCQAHITALASEGMELSRQGRPEAAVEHLISAGEQHLNAKLLEMAIGVARRHEAVLPQAEALVERARAVMARSCLSANHIAGIQRSGRSPGGLQLRGQATVATESAPLPAEAAATSSSTRRSRRRTRPSCSATGTKSPAPMISPSGRRMRTSASWAATISPLLASTIGWISSTMRFSAKAVTI